MSIDFLKKDTEYQEKDLVDRTYFDVGPIMSHKYYSDFSKVSFMLRSLTLRY